MRFTQILSSSQSQIRQTAPNQPRAALAPRRPKPGEIYGMIVRQARALSAGLAANPARPVDADALSESVESVIDSLEESPSKLLVFVERSTADDYLPGHLANVCILCLATAQKMGLPKNARRAIGVGALFHDASGPNMTPQERLDRLKDFLSPLGPASRKTIENIVLQCQEKISGKGPKGLLAADISPEAQLTSLCHDYETQSHPGPDRIRRLSHDVLRALIEQAGESYDGRLLKKLWETLSLFPPGSFVRLSTGEMAKVLEIQDADPIKPRVQIVTDIFGRRVRDEQIMDLAQTAKASIESAVDECSGKVQDPALQLELKAQKWWMDS